MKSIGRKRWAVGITSFLAVLGLLLWAVSVPLALADQIVVCQSCTTAPGGDPNLITNLGAFNMFIEGAGTSVAPTLIIIAEYNGVGGLPTVTVNGSSIGLAAVGTLGLTANTLAGYSASPPSIFGALGLPSGGSMSFVNMSSADVAHGFAAPTSYTLYAFNYNAGLSNTPVHVGTNAALGSFVAGYGCQVSTTAPNVCSPNGNISQTVFTNTGLLVPEPASLLLLGAGLAGIGMWRRIAVKV